MLHHNILPDFLENFLILRHAAVNAVLQVLDGVFQQVELAERDEG